MNKLKHTPLYELHVQAGARLTDFAGWAMPLSYGSQIEEHHTVRRAVGMFDVSHMRIIDVQGAQAQLYLRRLLANDVTQLKQVGRALYSCMLNHEGGVLDDLLVYFFGAESWRLVVNAGQAQIDFSWMQKLATDENFDVKLIVRSELAIIALQGPEAFERLGQVRPAWNEALRDLARFSSTYVDEVVMVARTGYTGEDGYEIVLPDSLAPALWNDLAQAGVRPCGLAARDTLRLEAGLNLYGQDMDETTRPAQAALGWTVDLRDQTRRFIGREALEQGGAAAQQLVGLRLLGRGIMRNGAKVKTPYGAGVVTSGTMSPTLGASIALARVPQDVRADDTLQVEVRGKWMDARVVKMPFVRSGTAAALNKLKV